mmetsp:Transcript_35338/g.97765  ORF Transcript_35338/g.97765 Transcript_35338/m.97765 type:complete len:254 (-) Transcript_35338:228-989(-)
MLTSTSEFVQLLIALRYDHSKGSVAAQAGNMILAANSVYIVLPVLISWASPASALRSLTPAMRCARRALLAELLCACCASFVAWYKWSGWKGMLDQACASGAVLASLVFGCVRSGNTWATWCCAALAPLTVMLFFSRATLESWGCPAPFPHFFFRLAGCLLCIVALTAELVYRSARQLVLALGIVTLLGTAHAYVELRCMLSIRGWSWTRGNWLGSVARHTAMMLLIACLMLAVPQRACPGTREESYDGSEEE